MNPKTSRLNPEKMNKPFLSDVKGGYHLRFMFIFVCAKMSKFFLFLSKEVPIYESSGESAVRGGWIRGDEEAAGLHHVSLR